MKQFINILLLIVLTLLQITVLPKFNIYIDLSMLVMLSLILARRLDLAKIWIAGGLLLDLCSPTIFGNYTITFIIIYLISKYFSEKIHHDIEFYTVILFFSIATLIIDVPFLYKNFSGHILAINIIINCTIGYILYWLARYYLEPKKIITVDL